MKNPEMFDISATLMLAALYESFPLPLTLKFEELYFQISDKFPDSEYEEYERLYLVIEASLSWLERSGYVYVGYVVDKEASDVILTEKGLRALRSIPKSIDIEKETVGDILAQAGKEGTKSAVLQGIGALFGGFMAAAT